MCVCSTCVCVCVPSFSFNHRQRDKSVPPICWPGPKNREKRLEREETDKRNGSEKRYSWKILVWLMIRFPREREIKHTKLFHRLLFQLLSFLTQNPAHLKQKGQVNIQKVRIHYLGKKIAGSFLTFCPSAFQSSAENNEMKTERPVWHLLFHRLFKRFLREQILPKFSSILKHVNSRQQSMMEVKSVVRCLKWHSLSFCICVICKCTVSKCTQ